MVWYSHLFKNFPQFVVIYTVKGFGIVNKAEVYIFLEFSYLFYDPTDKELDMFIIIQARLQQYMNHELPDVKQDLEKAEEPEIKLPTSVESYKKRIPEKYLILLHWLP